ncbi:MAG: hypothetical protein ACI86S_000640 [Paracoccaceae bacterium]|jgi:uncharacterized protein YgbK (DUF1537 family)
MKIGVIADDFTGASDIALTLAVGGMTTVQYVGVPNGAAGDVDAGVVALKSRTIPALDAVAQSLKACDWLLAQGVTQIIFKVCSTFDSTANGNIGPVTAALAARLGEAGVIVCPAFPENGRSVYQGHLFVNDGLLNESGMQDHPLTPMTDADLRRVLAAQTDWPIAHIDFRTVDRGADAIKSAMPASPAMVIVDAVRDADLIQVGAAAKHRKLLVGGSGIAIGLPANFGHAPAAPQWAGISGKAAILSGSCSRATRAQVHAYTGPKREITAEQVMDATVDAEGLANWVISTDGAPLIYSSADPNVVRAAQDTYGRDVVAHRIEALFTDLTACLVARNIKRLIVAGGETSGAAVTGLNAPALRIGPKLAAGVPAMRVEGTDIAIALKSGNFGGPDFFAQSLQLLEQST